MLRAVANSHLSAITLTKGLLRWLASSAAKRERYPGGCTGRFAAAVTRYNEKAFFYSHFAVLISYFLSIMLMILH